METKDTTQETQNPAQAQAAEQAKPAEGAAPATSNGVARTWEQLAEEHKTEPWQVNAVRVKYQLPAGREVSEEEWKKMVDDVANLTVGHAPNSVPKP